MRNAKAMMSDSNVTMRATLLEMNPVKKTNFGELSKMDCPLINYNHRQKQVLMYSKDVCLNIVKANTVAVYRKEGEYELVMGIFLDFKGDVVKLPVIHRCNSDQYYLLEREHTDVCRRKQGLIANYKVVEKHVSSYEDREGKTVLSLCGYTVDMAIDWAWKDTVRWGILDRIIENDILSSTYIINKLYKQIEERDGKVKYMDAVKRWCKDIRHIEPAFSDPYGIMTA